MIWGSSPLAPGWVNNIVQTTLGVATNLLTQTITVTSGTTTPATATTTPPYLFIQHLHRGMSGLDVIALQHILQGGSYLSASTTGYFGPLTQKAVELYQYDNGIPATGFVGPLTIQALNH